MLSVKELDRAIKLKAYGRFLTSNHPLLTQLRDKSNLSSFFNVGIPEIDSVLTEAVKFLKEDRQKIMNWELNLQESNPLLVAAIRDMMVKDILTPAGKQSIAFLMARARSARGINLKLKELRREDWSRLAIHLKYRDLLRLINASLNLNVPSDSLLQSSLYPIKRGHLGDLRKLSIKSIRESRQNVTEQTICIYKIGLILSPGEVLNWTGKIRKLTSVRHKSTLLRIAHGEIYSNSRLFKFGLVPSAACNNCDHEMETITHKILECPTAKTAWDKLNEVKLSLGLENEPINLEQIIGATNETKEKLSLVLNAELLQRIIGQGGKTYNPQLIVQQVIRATLINESLGPDIRSKLKNCITT